MKSIVSLRNPMNELVKLSTTRMPTSIFRNLMTRPVFTRFASTFNANRPSSSSAFKDAKVKVFDREIYYAETTGHPPNAPTIFFMPGAIGAVELDFMPLIPQLSKKYRWIAWDAVGQGRSHPPKRDFCSDKYELASVPDAKYASELLKILGIERYILLAWSGAFVTAIWMIQQNPERVAGLLTWGASAYAYPELIPPSEEMINAGLQAIPEKRCKQLIALYGEELLLDLWVGWLNECIRAAQESTVYCKDGSFKEVMSTVKCPTLIIQGMKDGLVPPFHANYLNEAIKSSRLHTFKNGSHNLHLRETQEFLNCVHSFVDNDVLKGSCNC